LCVDYFFRKERVRMETAEKVVVFRGMAAELRRAVVEGIKEGREHLAPLLTASEVILFAAGAMEGLQASVDLLAREKMELMELLNEAQGGKARAEYLLGQMKAVAASRGRGRRKR
jgi:conjugal transfer/entry exclusion protein